MKFLLATALAAMLGCTSLHTDYVLADEKAWKHFDPYIDKWIDDEPDFSEGKKEALHLLNIGRRVRIKKGVASVTTSN